MAADEKYPVLDRDNLTIPIQIQLSQKQKTFSQFLCAFLKSLLNFKYFEKKMTPRVFAFPKLLLRKRGQIKFDKQHVKRAQALVKSASQHLNYMHWSLPRQLNWKKSLLVTSQILWLLANILAANENYPVLTRDNLTIAIQMRFCQKPKTFSQFVGSFSKSTINFKYFEKHMTTRDFLFPKYGLRKRGQINV